MAKNKHIKNGNLYLGIAIGMMAILFVASSQTYEQQSQVSLLEKLLKNQPFKEFFGTISFNYGGSPVSLASSGYYQFVEFFIRKGAHFISYFIIGGSLFLGLQPRLKQLSLTALISWLAATGYAGLDESHQLLTGGRSALFQDVMLDSLGALTAISLCLVVSIFRKIKK
ncbi:VanZ family protein [Vagococcus salmoninarum]|nr:VanZ family protein [Vagococcus salmoninarum]